jgi:hypothetical protein
MSNERKQAVPGMSSSCCSGWRRRRKCGHCATNNFIAGIERGQRVRLQRDMWKLCDENRRLGGKYWRSVLRKFGLTESEVWPNTKSEVSG